jgi:hypothetical protein
VDDWIRMVGGESAIAGLLRMVYLFRRLGTDSWFSNLLYQFWMSGNGWMVDCNYSSWDRMVEKEMFFVGGLLRMVYYQMFLMHGLHDWYWMVNYRGKNALCGRFIMPY